jgi:hypothetical protein
MLKIERIYSCLQDEDYDIALPLTVQDVEIRSDLRFLATLIRYGMAESVHVSERETIVVIASSQCRIGFIWKLMPSGNLLLRGIQNLDEFKVAVVSAKVIPFSKVRKGVAA